MPQPPLSKSQKRSETLSAILTEAAHDQGYEVRSAQSKHLEYVCQCRQAETCNKDECHWAIWCVAVQDRFALGVQFDFHNGDSTCVCVLQSRMRLIAVWKDRYPGNISSTSTAALLREAPPPFTSRIRIRFRFRSPFARGFSSVIHASCRRTRKRKRRRRQSPSLHRSHFPLHSVWSANQIQLLASHIASRGPDVKIASGGGSRQVLCRDFDRTSQ